MLITCSSGRYINKHTLYTLCIIPYTGVICYTFYGLEAYTPWTYSFFYVSGLLQYTVHMQLTICLSLFFFCIVEYNHYFLQERLQPVFNVLLFSFYITYVIRYTERCILICNTIPTFLQDAAICTFYFRVYCLSHYSPL